MFASQLVYSQYADRFFHCLAVAQACGETPSPGSVAPPLVLVACRCAAQSRGEFLSRC
jgi:hypothetical protein